MTKKELMDIGGGVYRLGYCEAQTILTRLVARGEAVKVGHNYGSFGWNWDGFAILNGASRVLVCTGYQPFGKEPADRKGLRALEKRAGEKERGITAKKLIKLLRGY